MATKPVEWQMKGHSTVSAYLVSKGAQKVIDFMIEMLNAHQMYKQTNEDGTVKHASLRIGDTVVMVTDANDEHPAQTVWMFVYVQDVDKTYELALSKGAESVEAPVDKPYGDRMGAIKDPAGNTWWIATHMFNPYGCTGDAQVAE
ncbi:uncharacterized protein [Physcomitrium patens]|uniref:VOC domain-containing protein n=1 Tax=Physcomitrium patens TaxID=3218 RepID=A9TLX8_PHYPA|nr:uncharacterized protein LOC112289468 [Physcomitrium patens]PNR43807.1 hypothetical protein PHYPA_016190 [Physcomitrium patens]|eukprot:XP_024390476.1 uncharacterized protein LOC112289468 [Physcomitrella patens]